jgi:hypothetical protein
LVEICRGGVEIVAADGEGEGRGDWVLGVPGELRESVEDCVVAGGLDAEIYSGRAGNLAEEEGKAGDGSLGVFIGDQP